MLNDPFRLGPTSEVPVFFDWTRWLAGAAVGSVTVAVGPGLTLLHEAQAAGVVGAWIKWTDAPTSAAAASWVDCTVVTDETPARKETDRYTVLARLPTVELGA